MENREKIVKIGLQMIKSGLTKGTWGNISIKEGDILYITPSGIEYHKLKTVEVSTINMKTGEQISGLKPSSELLMHKAIYEKCPDINAIVHTHSTYATAYAIAGKTVPCCTEDHAEVIGGHIPCPPYSEAGSLELGLAAAEALQHGKIYASLMANHGLVAIGRSLNEAYIVAEIAEKSAKAVHLAASINPEFKPLPGKYIAVSRESYINSYSKKIVKD